MSTEHTDQIDGETFMLRANEVDSLLARIVRARDPEGTAALEKEHARYQKFIDAGLIDREDIPVVAWSDGDGGWKEVGANGWQRSKLPGVVSKTKRAGMTKALVRFTDGTKERWVGLKPKMLDATAYGYSGYIRSGDISLHASQYGLLASPRYNREIRPKQVDEYAAEMRRGRWQTLLSDPIAITEDGHVLNGQHRLAAASGVDWLGVEHVPLFLVVWGVDPGECMLADGSRRTAREEKTIATKLVSEWRPAPASRDELTAEQRAQLDAGIEEKYGATAA